MQKQETFIIATNKAIAKLRKYYPLNTPLIGSENKALYYSLILDPRVKKDGLLNLGLNSRQISDIST